MSRAKVEEKVRDLIAQQCVLVERSELSDAHRLKEDLNFDDLDFAELGIALEEAFDFQVLDEDFEKLRTVKDVIDFVGEATAP